MSRLDTGLDPADCRDLAEWLREEYVTAYGDAPTGFLAPCRLGQPYVDHQLDLFHTTVDHYAPSDLVPEPLSSFRVLVRAGECAYVETYQGGLVLPVLHDGTVVQT